MIRESSTTFTCISGENPGTIKVEISGINKNTTTQTDMMTTKNTVKTSLMNFRADAVTVPSGIRSNTNGIITVTEASEAMQVKIRSGIRKAA